MYNVTIKYTAASAVDMLGPVADPICRMMQPTGSYIDSPAYVDGMPNDFSTSAGSYGKSIYATNVPGDGYLPVAEPYASTSVPFPSPLAQFKLAMVGEDLLDADENVIGKQVTFQVEDYKEAFYFKTLGAQMADQGFEVIVELVTDEAEDDNG